MRHEKHLNLLRGIVHSQETLRVARTNPKAFTRKRSMGFADSLCFQLDMRKTTLQTRLNLYFTRKGGDPISQQAFSKLRANYDHSPFETMVREMVKSEYADDAEPLKWNGYHVFAVDGSTLQLPRTDEMRMEFGTRGRGHICPCAGVSVLFDVMQGWAVDPIFERANRNERTACARHIDFLSQKLPETAKSSILLLDRGYPSYELFEKMQQASLRFLVRCSTVSFPAVVNAPMGSSVITTANPGKRKNPLKLRVFKFTLPSGEVEILATNLFELPDSMLPELYGLRWGIETAYHRLKRELCVENFSGKTPNSVRQDFWASIVMLNMVAVFQKEADAAVLERQKGKNLKHFNRARTSDLIVTLRDRFVFLTLRGGSGNTLADLDGIVRSLSRAVSPSRPGRSFPRRHIPYPLATNLQLKSHL